MRRSVQQMAPRLMAEAGGFRGVDAWLTVAFVSLACFGVLMVYSSSIADAYDLHGSPYYFLKREIIWVVLGFVALGITTRIHYLRWRRAALPLFALALAMLGLVMIPHIGHVSNGARRWLQINSTLAIEPSEVMKLGLVIYLAAWLPTKGELVRDFKACFVPFSLILGIICLFVVKQPDLGTAIVIAVTALSIFFVAGADLTQLALAALGSAGVAAALAHNESYRNSRITAFINPWSDPGGAGYHTIQALLALRYGGIFGRGLGNSVQKYVLPAPHTDSILAVIGEECGLVGTLAVMVLFLVVAYRGIRIAIAAPDPFGRLLATGITSWVTFQALMNFAVITSSVPFTGVPLPFVSYGGTSLIISMAAMGILLNISRHATGEGFARQHSDHRRGDRRSRVPRVIHHPAPAKVSHLPAGRGTAPRGAKRRSEAGNPAVR